MEEEKIVTVSLTNDKKSNISVKAESNICIKEEEKTRQKPNISIKPEIMIYIDKE